MSDVIRRTTQAQRDLVNSIPLDMSDSEDYMNAEFVAEQKPKTIDFDLRKENDVDLSLHPTEKNHSLLMELIRDNSNEGDIEIVIDLLDAINDTESDRVDGIKQFVQALMVFKNCAIDEDTFTKLRQAGALSIKSTRDMDSSVDMLVQELSQGDTQTVVDDMWDCVQSILGMPNQLGNSTGGGDTQGAVELRNGWDFSKQRAKLKDPYVKSAEKKFVKLILNRIASTNKDCDISARDIAVKINHSPTDNLLVKTQALQNLLSSGVDPQSAISTVGLFSDPEKVYLASKNALDVNFLEKAVATLSAMLSAGFSVEEACKKAGFDPKTIDTSRWETEPTEETIEVIE